MYYTKLTIEHIVTHEIGHVIGINAHNLDETSHMYNIYTGVDNQETFGLVVPTNDVSISDRYSYETEKQFLDMIERIHSGELERKEGLILLENRYVC